MASRPISSRSWSRAASSPAASNAARARALGSIALLLTCLCACAPLPRYESRPARSSLGCMRSTLEAHGALPQPDTQAHCVAAGLIARHCSVSEAWLASIAKEIRDVLGPGNAEWRDLASDRRGIQCARTAGDDAQLVACCTGSAEAP